MNKKTVVNRLFTFYIQQNGQNIAVDVKAESREAARLRLMGEWPALRAEDIRENEQEDMAQPVPGLDMASKITGMVKYLKMEKKALAECLGTTQNHFSQRMHKGTLSLRDLEKIAHRAGAELRVYFVIGEEGKFHDNAVRF